MKKVLVIALMLGAGLAYASSIGVPWFVDNAGLGSWPPATPGNMGFVYLHNNATEELTCTIAYYTDQGFYIGPTTDNTFVIAANASTAFRPVADDPALETSGLLIPNRPRTTLPPSTPENDNKKNGSIVISWTGDPSLVTGTYVADLTVNQAVGSGDSTLVYKLAGYGHLLPAGN